MRDLARSHWRIFLQWAGWHSQGTCQPQSIFFQKLLQNDLKAQGDNILGRVDFNANGPLSQQRPPPLPSRAYTKRATSPGLSHLSESSHKKIRPCQVRKSGEKRKASQQIVQPAPAVSMRMQEYIRRGVINSSQGNSAMPNRLHPGVSCPPNPSSSVGKVQNSNEGIPSAMNNYIVDGRVAFSSLGVCLTGARAPNNCDGKGNSHPSSMHKSSIIATLHGPEEVTK